MFLAPTNIKTKIAGVTFGEIHAVKEKSWRQLALEAAQKKLVKDPYSHIDLILEPEPTNIHDPDAIKVKIRFEAHGIYDLGYVANKERKCSVCEKEFEKRVKSTDHPDKCPTCGGSLVRAGLASQISEAMRNGISYRALLLQVTGGILDKNTNKVSSFGCNIEIQKV